jgi:hypothetical protein
MCMVSLSASCLAQQANLLRVVVVLAERSSHIDMCVCWLLLFLFISTSRCLVVVPSNMCNLYYMLYCAMYVTCATVSVPATSIAPADAFCAVLPINSVLLMIIALSGSAMSIAPPLAVNALL